VTPIDIRPADLATVRRILREHVPALEVRAFGSRVAWNARETSDLDLALMTDEPLGIDRTAGLRAAFTDSDLPFRVDIVDWATASEKFRQRILADHVLLRAQAAKSAPSTKGPTVVRVKTPRRGDCDAWRDTTLRELIDIGHGFAFSGRFIHDEPHGDILLTPGNVAVGGGFKGQRFKYYSGPVPSDFVLSEGDLIVTMTDLSKASDTLGYPAFVPETVDGKCYLHNQRLGKITLRTGDIDARFLFYAMCSSDYRHEVLASATGTTVKHTSPDRILRFRLQLPPLTEQRAIAHILGTLDDKIELNRRMNATLEAMAGALFRSWFVDFDPVRAKMAGRDTALPREVADLFPDRLVDSELGSVPDEWDVGVLDDAVELLSGGTPRTSVERFWNGDIPWYTAKDAPAPHDVFAVETERTITQAGVDNSATAVLPSGTTVISARGSVGRLACLGRPMAMNQTCYGIRGAGGYGDFFTYWLVKVTVEELRSRTHGTIFDTITRQTFALVNSALPPVSVADAFEAMVQPIMERILNNLHQSGAIAALRDTLLPKLVSGELRVDRSEPASGRDDHPVPVGTHGA